MAIESAVSVTVEFDAIPFLPGAYDLAADGVMAGGSRRNLAWGLHFVDVGEHAELHQLLVADAQTSGGLVFGIDPAHTDAVLRDLADSGHTAGRIGTVTTGSPGLVLR
jgi:selenide,water dikinase